MGGRFADRPDRTQVTASPSSATSSIKDGEVPQIDLPDTRPDPLEDLSRARLRQELDAAIDRLPDDYRELISLRHYGELPYEEIAELKEMPLGTVKNKLFRARQTLRDLLPKSTV